MNLFERFRVFFKPKSVVKKPRVSPKRKLVLSRIFEVDQRKHFYGQSMEQIARELFDGKVSACYLSEIYRKWRG